MNAATPSLFDDIVAVFRRACEEENYGVANHLLAALESMARKDDMALDDVYLSFAYAGPAHSTPPEPPACQA